jgi:hypothetical protein
MLPVSPVFDFPSIDQPLNIGDRVIFDKNTGDVGIEDAYGVIVAPGILLECPSEWDVVERDDDVAIRVLPPAPDSPFWTFCAGNSITYLGPQHYIYYRHKEDLDCRVYVADLNPGWLVRMRFPAELWNEDIAQDQVALFAHCGIVKLEREE